MNGELEPCPFCGCTAEIIKFSGGEYMAECQGAQCCVGPYRSTEKEAIEAWNRRATR